MTLISGNCLDRLKELPENSIDSIVTDPPYGLKFMNKAWDYDVPSVEIWKECLRVLKPGGHLLSFGGTRTYHRMTVNIEDAGYEIRDQIQWIYGSGFPKSHNFKDEWQGFGTALKPANEPICLARKPLEKGLTIAENVLKWGTGALNIDGSRIATSDKINSTVSQNIRGHLIGSGNSQKERDVLYEQNPQGRWPANVIFDEEAAQVLDEQTQFLHGAGASRNDSKNPRLAKHLPTSWSQSRDTGVMHRFGDQGGASRLFYVAKASKSERNAGLDSFDCCQVKHTTCDENTELETLIVKAIFESMPSSNIVVSGDHIMVTCPKECTSTIRTAIQQITELKTWNWLIHSLTSGSTPDAPCATTLGINLVACVERLRELTKQTGTLQDKDGSLMVGAAHATYQKLSQISDEKNWKTFNSFHPTVKPIRLMQYLIKLITPPKGTVLDPFMGSGSTGVAAKQLGFKFVGIELNEEYLEIAKRRIGAAK